MNYFVIFGLGSGFVSRNMSGRNEVRNLFVRTPEIFAGILDSSRIASIEGLSLIADRLCNYVKSRTHIFDNFPSKGF